MFYSPRVYNRGPWSSGRELVAVDPEPAGPVRELVAVVLARELVGLIRGLLPANPRRAVAAHP